MKIILTLSLSLLALFGFNVQASVVNVNVFKTDYSSVIDDEACYNSIRLDYTDCTSIASFEYNNQNIQYNFFAQYNEQNDSLYVSLKSAFPLETEQLDHSFFINGEISPGLDSSFYLQSENNKLISFDAGVGFGDYYDGYYYSIRFDGNFLDIFVQSAGSANYNSSYSYDERVDKWTRYEVLSEVPIPASTWLFGSALLGLSIIRRRK